jgi:hypothetical protein
MKALDKLLDQKPTAHCVQEMAEARIRNLLCFRELQSLNDTGKFLYKHPLIANRSELSMLEQLFRRDPTEFLKQYNRAQKNVSRYTTYLSKKEREKYRESDKLHLNKYKATLQMFSEIIAKGNERN